MSTKTACLADAVRHYRYVKQMSQAALAEASGVSLPTIKRLEGGRGGSSVSLRTVERLALGLGVPVADLLSPTVGADRRRKRDRNIQRPEGAPRHAR